MSRRFTISSKSPVKGTSSSERASEGSTSSGEGAAAAGSPSSASDGGSARGAGVAWDGEDGGDGVPPEQLMVAARSAPKTKREQVMASVAAARGGDGRSVVNAS